jgi:hypothetical protein
MNPELTCTWWSNNKAKTLLNEPLSAALKNIQNDQDNLKKRRRAEDVESILGKMRSILEAIDATSRMCIPGLHGTTKQNLTVLKTKAVEYQNKLREDLGKYQIEQMARVQIG